MISTVIAALAIGFAGPAPTGPKLVVTMGNGKAFTIATDQKGSPKTVAHILALVKKKFYDGQKVHRVEEWVTQWGDPGTKNGSVDGPGIGSGGSGKDVPFEPSKTGFVRGVVGLASTGAQVGGDSQLFVLKRDAAYLNGNYAVVGVVTKGMGVVDGIKRGDKIKSIRIMAKQK
jgi:cyclophilin family peptidyl-prolyl cis-trans isomerase